MTKMIKPIRTKLALCFLLLPAALCPAQQTLTLGEAQGLAEEHSIALQKEALNVEMDRIRAKNLWAQVFPSISVSGGANYSIPLNSNARPGDPAYTARLSLSLGLHGGLPAAMANLSLAYKNGLLNYEEARRRLRTQTAKDFYSLLSEQSRLLSLEGATRLAEEQLERDRIARRNGYVGELDFLSASLSAERARLAYNRARSDYRAALGNFTAALGLEGEPALADSAALVPLDLDTERLIAGGLPRRPDLQALRNEAERLKNARNESFFAAKGPQVNLSASLGANLENGFDDAASAGISVTIPLDPWIPRSAKDQAVRQARTNYEKALLDVADRERSARREILNAAENVRNTWAEVEIARLQNDYARRAFELAADAYRRGTMNFLDYERVRNNQTEARQQLLQSELNYRILVLDLALSLNMETEELANYVRTGEESGGDQ